QVLAYRAATAVISAVNVGLFALTVRQFAPRFALPMVALFAWNPLLLFEFSGNGHNDALLLTFLLLAVYLAARGWLLPALVALSLSAMVKFVTVLILPLFVLYWVRRQATRRRQAGALLAGALVPLGVAAALYAP